MSCASSVTSSSRKSAVTSLWSWKGASRRWRKDLILARISVLCHCYRYCHRMKFYLIAPFAIFLFFSLFVVQVNATEPGPGGTIRGGTGEVRLINPLGDRTIIQIINDILDFLIYLSVPLLALMILVGGFQILMARESAEKVKNGFNTIKYAVIGFVVILISKGIALVILNILRR